MSVSFSATIARWVRDNEIALNAVAQESAQLLVEEVVKPITKGGKIPVRDGFLRNSLTAEINNIPSGEGEASEGFSRERFYQRPAIALVLNKLKAGDRLVLGFTANYARAMEYRYYFVRSAAMNWPLHVDKSIKKVAKAIR